MKVVSDAPLSCGIVGRQADVAGGVRGSTRMSSGSVVVAPASCRGRRSASCLRWRRPGRSRRAGPWSRSCRRTATPSIDEPAAVQDGRPARRARADARSTRARVVGRDREVEADLRARGDGDRRVGRGQRDGAPAADVRRVPQASSTRVLRSTPRAASLADRDRRPRPCDTIGTGHLLCDVLSHRLPVDTPDVGARVPASQSARSVPRRQAGRNQPMIR